MPVLQVAFKATAPKAVVVQLDGASPPANHTDIGSFDHPDPVYPGSLVLFHGVRDALYKVGELDTSIVNITLADGLVVPPNSIYVQPASLDLQTQDPLYKVGEIHAYVYPLSAGNTGVTYTSSDEDVATVNEDGTVTAVGFGYAEITVASAATPAIKKIVGVSVGGAQQAPESVPVASVSLTPPTATINGSGATQQLTATVLPANATDKTVTYSSSAPSVATVSPTGLVTAVASTGTTTITVTTNDGAKTDTSTITVGVAVTGVVVDPKVIAGLGLGGTQQLTATVSPAGATNQNVTWVSSAPGVATVSSTGMVTGMANGNATVTVTTVDGGFTDICDVTVADL